MSNVWIDKQEYRTIRIPVEGAQTEEGPKSLKEMGRINNFVNENKSTIASGHRSPSLLIDFYAPPLDSSVSSVV
jgi:hypothetical protein